MAPVGGILIICHRWCCNAFLTMDKCQLMNFYRFLSGYPRYRSNLAYCITVVPCLCLIPAQY